MKKILSKDDSCVNLVDGIITGLQLPPGIEVMPGKLVLKVWLPLITRFVVGSRDQKYEAGGKSRVR